MTNYDLTVPGWMTEPELQALSEIAQNCKPATVLEIGSFAGRSSICWAMNLPDARIDCVDTWAPDRISDVWWMSNDTYVWQPFSEDEKRRSLYSVFLERTAPYPNIRNFRIDSRRFCPIARKLGRSYDLIFIDGDHSEQGFADDILIASLLIKETGVVAIHDYKGKDFPHITTMFQKWAGQNNREIREWPGTMVAASYPRLPRTKKNAI